MKKTLLTLATICLTSAQVLFAQSRTVKGTVLDQDGNPLMLTLVKVVYQGNETSTNTDENGQYELLVPDGATQLIIEADGYSKKTIKITEESSTTTLSFQSQVNDLDGATISTPYGGQIAKIKSVGAGDQIGSEKIGKMAITTASRAIEGNAPGVQVTNGGGQPGANASFRIRGFSSLNGNNDPLIVLDGTPYMGNFNSINPADIATIDVLKDATATSLYGSRGANGVIMVTTKGGSKNKRTTINVDARVGVISRAIPNYNILTEAKDYYEFAFDAYRNQLISSGYTNDEAISIARGLNLAEGEGLVSLLGGYNSYDVPDDQLMGADGKVNPNATLRYQDNWDKELQRNGITQNYNVSATGGSDKNSFYMSAGYLNEKSYMKNSDFERFTGRVNVNSYVNDWLTAGINLSGNMSTTNYMGSLGSTAGGYNPFFVSRNFAPIFPVYYYDSTNQRQIDPYTGQDKWDWGSLTEAPESSVSTRKSLPNANVLGTMTLNQDRTLNTTFVAVPYLEAKFLKDFKFKTVFNGNFVNIAQTNYRNPFYGDSKVYNGGVTKASANTTGYTWNQVLSWNKIFKGVHDFSAFVGHENYFYNYSQMSLNRQGIAIPGVGEAAGAAVAVDATSFTDYDRMESYFGQIGYGFKNKLFVTTNLRRDGSSRFAQKWGTFWSIGGSYILSEEQFVKDISWLNTLKVKASYGTQGSHGTALYAWQGLASIDYANGSNAGALITSLPNPDLTWEKQGSLNAGIEFAVLNKKISGEINYFSRTGRDQLFNRPYPLSTGIASRLENVMSTRNSGIEAALYFNLVDNYATNGFSWNMDINGAHFKNVITALPDGLDSIISSNFMYKVGQSYYDYYLVKSQGIDTSGNEMYGAYTADGRDTSVINHTDAVALNGRQYVGKSAIPTLQGGFNNNFSYKNLDLSIMLTFGIGGWFYDGAQQGLMGSLLSAGQNVSKDWLTDRWTVDNKSGTLPKAQFNNTQIGNNSDRFLVNRSYLNIRSINLGYTFKPATLKSVGIQSLRLYVAADNVWIFTKRQGLDPQSSFSGNATLGAEYGFTPNRTILFGVNLGL